MYRKMRQVFANFALLNSDHYESTAKIYLAD